MAPNRFAPAARLLLTAALAVTATASFADDAGAVREANNGNVILDHVPEIPERIGDRLSRYQDVRGASFRAWLPDSAGLYVTTRFADTSQLHRVDTPGGARRQLTFFAEPVGGVDRQPGGSYLNFTMDEGGSEFYQIFLFDPAGGHRRCFPQRRSLLEP